MKVVLNNGFYPELPNNFIISFGLIDGLEIKCNCEVGKHIAIVENEVVVSVEVWSGWIDKSWHEQTKYQIKFTPIDLLELLKEVPAMIDYVNTLTVYSDEFGNQYLYVNYFVDMERELIERYGAIIKERS